MALFDKYNQRVYAPEGKGDYGIIVGPIEVEGPISKAPVADQQKFAGLIRNELSDFLLNPVNHPVVFNHPRSNKK